jgi:hypothetical protein
MKSGDKVKIVNLTYYCHENTVCSVCKPQRNCISFTGIVTQMSPIRVKVDNTGSVCKFSSNDIEVFSARELI